MKKSLYRKYRPKAFSEISGQENAVITLKSALSLKNISHAWIFCGPRGTGKTTSAQVFAKSLNCLNSEEGIACNKCEHCLLFQKGTYVDYIEMDAASNRGIDEFRFVKEQAFTPPLMGKNFYKVFVIDEAHMLTKEASNAFLKTLEEPPLWCVFILATTEPDKLLATIQSRCIRLDFNLISPLNIVKRLKEITLAENISIEDAALNRIVEKSEGGLRDALTNLEQAVFLCGNNISLNQYLELMGESSQQEIDDLLLFLINKESKTLLERVKFLLDSGKQSFDIIRQLIKRAEEGLYFSFNIEREIAPMPQAFFNIQSNQWTLVLSNLLKAQDLMLGSLFPAIHLELHLLAICELTDTSKTDSLAKSSFDGLLKKVANLEKKLSDPANILLKPDKAVTKVIPEPIVKDKSFSHLPDYKQKWEQIRKYLRAKEPILFALVEPAEIDFNDNKLSLVYADKYNFHFNKIQDQKNYANLANFVFDTFGDQVKIEIVLGDVKFTEDRQVDSNHSINLKTKVFLSESKGGGNQVSEDLKRKVLEEPKVAALIEKLEAKIEDIL